MWDLPRPGLEPVSLALAGRFSTPAPPGKPQMFWCYSKRLWTPALDNLPQGSYSLWGAALWIVESTENNRSVPQNSASNRIVLIINNAVIFIAVSFRKQALTYKGEFVGSDQISSATVTQSSTKWSNEQISSHWNSGFHWLSVKIAKCKAMWDTRLHFNRIFNSPFKKQKRRELLQTYFIRPSSPWYQNQIGRASCRERV